MFSNCGAGEDSRETLNSKAIKPILRETNQLFIGRTDDEPEAPVLWPNDAKS